MTFLEKSIKGLGAKYLLILAVLILLTVVCVMLGLDVSFHEMFVSAPQSLVDEFLETVSFENLARGTLINMPFMKHIPTIKFIGKILNVYAGFSHATDYSKDLFGQVFNALLSIVVLIPLFSVFRSIKELVDKKLGWKVPVISSCFDMVLCILVAYVGVANVAFLRKFFIRVLYNRGRVLTFIVIVAVVLIGSYIYTLFKNRSAAGLLKSGAIQALKVFFDLLTICAAYTVFAGLCLLDYFSMMTMSERVATVAILLLGAVAVVALVWITIRMKRYLAKNANNTK